MLLIAIVGCEIDDYVYDTDSSLYAEPTLGCDSDLCKVLSNMTMEADSKIYDN